MNDLLQDIRYSIRQFGRSPGFTLVAVLTLALGIGANAAIFSVIRAVLLDEAPFPDADRVVMVWSDNVERGWNRFGTSMQDFQDFAADNDVFAQIGAFHTGQANLVAGDSAVRVGFSFVTPSLLEALAVEPAIGRRFREEENAPGASDVVLISDALWRSRLGADPDIGDATLVLNEERVRVIGVMPPGFDFPGDGNDIWKPFGLGPDDGGSRGARWLTVVARLRGDVSLPRAQSAMDSLALGLAEAHPDTNTGWSVSLRPYAASRVDHLRPALLTLWGTVGIILLIACANVTNLLLARSRTRAREIAVRSALGAGRWRITRQLLTESLVLSVAGGALGLLIGSWGLALMLRGAAGVLPTWSHVELDLRVLVFTALISMAAAAISGWMPALRGSRADLNEALKDGGRTADAPGQARLRSGLVVAEVALAVIVLVTAGLMLRSLNGLTRVDPGFEPDRLLTLRVAPPMGVDPAEHDSPGSFFAARAESLDGAEAFWGTLQQRVANLPGVESVSAVNRLPLSGNWWNESLYVQGEPEPEPGETRSVNGRVVLPDYFATMGVPLLSGRGIDAADRADAARVAVINRTMREQFFGDEDPLGRQISFDPAQNPDRRWHTIVGVVGDVRHNRVQLAPRPIVYVSLPQSRSGFFGDWGMDLVIRTAIEPLGVASSVQAEVQRLDASLPTFQLLPMNEIVAVDLAEHRFQTRLLSVFAALAFVLALVGIYGLLSFLVGQRVREFGVRRALGARTIDILGLVLGRGMLLTGIGVGVGIASAAAVARLIASQLYGIKPSDPLTFLTTSLLLVAVAFLAGLIPALRATRIDPQAALRCE